MGINIKKVVGKSARHSISKALRNPLHTKPFKFAGIRPLDKWRRNSGIAGHVLKRRLFGAGTVNSAGAIPVSYPSRSISEMM